MDPKISELLQKMSVKITFKNKQGSGFATGFFVAPKIVITCSHGLRGIGRNSLEISSFQAANRIKGQIYKDNLHYDVTYIETDIFDENATCGELDFDPNACQFNDELIIYAFSEEHPGGILSSAKVGQFGTKYASLRFTSKQQRYGYGGAAAFNLRTGKVCGLINDTNVTSPGTTCQLIPAHDLPNAEFNLEALQKEYHKLVSIPALKSNLPTQLYSDFLGRKEELKEVHEFLSPKNRSWILTIDGIGGIGKTALAVEAARQCVEGIPDESNTTPPKFDVIIFASAKKNTLRNARIIDRPIKESSLPDVFRVVSEVLRDQSIMQVSETQQKTNRIYDSLKKYAALLIIDNLETFDDSTKGFDELMKFLRGLPAGTKAILTSRIKIGYHEHLDLKPLEEADSILLAKNHAKDNKIELSDDDAFRIYKNYGGIPLAMINVIALLGQGHDRETLLGAHNEPISDIMQFVFEQIKTFLSPPELTLFKSFSFFSEAPILGALAHVASLPESMMNDHIEGLAKLSLVTPDCGRYHMVSFTRRYAIKILEEDASHREIMRERWIEWYKNLGKKYGGRDGKGWSYRYSFLKEEQGNLQSVIRWCFENDRLDDIVEFWKHLGNYLDVCGYWEDRIIILDYLIVKTAMAGDKAILAEAYASRGWTRVLQGGNHQADAQADLLKAYRQRRHLNPENKARLANYFAVFRITQEELPKALIWLNREDKLANKIQNVAERERAKVRVAYYKGEIFFRLHDYCKAQTWLEKAREEGERIKWQRFVNYANNWLAEIDIKMDRFLDARHKCREGLEEAKQNREQRRVAHYQATYARLELSQKNYMDAKELATAALEIFKSAGIEKDAKEMESILAQIEIAKT